MSSDYWEKRESEALQYYIKEEAEYDRQIRKIYQNMLDACQKEIDAFYGKYAKSENITIAEAKKRVSKLDIEAYERKAQKYVANREFSKQANEEMRLYNATMRINRLEMLKANIGLELISGHDELEKFMGDILQGRTEEELKRQAGILGKTIRNNAKAANAIPNASFHNAKFSDRIWMYQSLMKSDLSKLLQSGLIQGKNPRVLAKELKQKFNVSTYNAERLMRTELARVQTEAQRQSYIANEVENYRFTALSNCCDICASLNGKYFSVKKMMPGENAPPMHPNCRCSTVEDNRELRKNLDAKLDWINNGGSLEDWIQRERSYEGAPRTWDKIKTENEKNDLKVINPKYKKFVSPWASDEELAYNRNCVNCVVAYDLRQRYHDVEACSYLECDIRRKADKLWEGSIERKKTGNIEQFIKEAKTKEQYERYFIGYSENIGSHAVIAECENGKVKIIDAQRGVVYNKIEEISNVLKGNIEYWRIDDLEPTQTAYNACKKR